MYTKVWRMSGALAILGIIEVFLVSSTPHHADIVVKRHSL
jgi:hypothetical protein